jgi:hypothetical protein
MAGRAHPITACAPAAEKGLSENRQHNPKQPGEVFFPRLLFLVFPHRVALAHSTRGQVSAEPEG